MAFAFAENWKDEACQTVGSTQDDAEIQADESTTGQEEKLRVVAA